MEVEKKAVDETVSPENKVIFGTPVNETVCVELANSSLVVVSVDETS